MSNECKMKDCLLAFNPKPHIVESIRAEEFEVVAVFPSEAPDFVKDEAVLVISDITDAAAVVTRCDEAGLLNRVVGVLTHSEATLGIASEVAQCLGLPANPAESVRLTMDKGAMRQALEGDETSVAFRVAQGARDVEEMLAHYGEVIAKPCDGAGSIGVRVLRDLSDSKGIDYPILLEEYLDGPEYSVEVLSAYGSHRILGITEKFLFPGSVVESGHLFPARLETDLALEIAAFTKGFLDRIGIRIGVTHTEIKLTSQGIRVIETHTRSGGDHIAKLVALSTGLDPLRASARIAAGHGLPPKAESSRWATIQYQQPPLGVVSRVLGLDEARHMPGVTFVETTLSPGIEVRAVENSLDRVLGIVAIGDSPEEALANASHALGRVRVEYT